MGSMVPQRSSTICSQSSPCSAFPQKSTARTTCARRIQHQSAPPVINKAKGMTESTSFVLRAFAQLVIQIKGVGEVTKRSYRPLCLRRHTVLLPPQRISSLRCLLAAVQFFGEHSPIPDQCKEHRMSLRITAQSASFFLRGDTSFPLMLVVSLKKELRCTIPRHVEKNLLKSSGFSGRVKHRPHS